MFFYVGSYRKGNEDSESFGINTAMLIEPQLKMLHMSPLQNEKKLMVEVKKSSLKMNEDTGKCGAPLKYRMVQYLER